MSEKKRIKLKVVAMFLLVTFVGQIIHPTAALALTGGPTQPEITQFQQVSASDMVDLFTGDFGYNIPLFEVPGPNGGYPFNLNYQSSPSMDQEASWVGLGWNINPGSIVRNMRGLPDDFDGQQIKREVDMKPNVTAGIGVNANIELLSADFRKENEGSSVALGLGIRLYYNNYKGMGYTFNIGASGSLPYNSNKIGAGMGLNFSFDSQDGGIGMNLDLTVSNSSKVKGMEGRNSFSAGVGYNTNSGISMSTRFSRATDITTKSKVGFTGSSQSGISYGSKNTSTSGGGSSSISFAYPTANPSIGTEMSGGSFTGGVTIGFDPGNTGANHLYVGFSAFIDVMEIANKTEFLPAYGYLNYHNKTNDEALVDFNRDKDAIVKSHSTVNLHNPILTYDYYMVNGQGTGGMFRPFRQEIGYIHEQSRRSGSGGGSLGFNIPGDGKKIGINVGFNYSDSKSGRWDENVNEVSLNHPGGSYPDDTRHFRGKQYDDSNYEGPFFKMNGTTSVIDEAHFNSIGGDDAVRFRIDHNDNVVKRDLVNNYTGNTYSSYNDVLSERRPRGQNIIPIYNSILTQNAGVESMNEMRVRSYTGLPATSGFYNENNLILTSYESREQADRHSHIGGFIVTNPDGNRYIYGLPAYNIKTKEHIYTGVPDKYGDCQTHRELDLDNNGAIRYKFEADGSSNQDDKYDITDQFKSVTTTPSYTHSHLLTSILGTDFVDSDNIPGPSDNDYGYWVKFNYIQTTNSDQHYKWRNPFTGANYIAGSEASYEDDKISFTYGEKEIWYLATVETKTHIAVFEMSKRMDGKGAATEINNYNSSGGHIDNSNEGTLYKLDKIKLYAKQEYKDNLASNTPEQATPIQTIHFEYDYSLCPGIPNNNGQPDYNKDVLGNQIPSGQENGGNINEGIPNPNFDPNFPVGPTNLPQLYGKLTLKAVYFTYKHDHTGKNHKYRFNYTSNKNYEYFNNRYDRWGTYNWYTDNGQCANSNFPYTNQFPQHPYPSVTNPELSPNPYNFQPGVNSYSDNTKRFIDETNSAAAAWCLNKIQLPSGGSINVVYESDDYGYVQHRESTQMFKITSFGFGNDPSNPNAPENDWLYDPDVDITQLGGTGIYNTTNCPRLRKVYFKLEHPIPASTNVDDVYKQIYRDYIHPLKRDDKYQVYINSRVYLRGNIAENLGSYYELDIDPGTINSLMTGNLAFPPDASNDGMNGEHICIPNERPFGVYQGTSTFSIDGIETPQPYYTHGYVVLKNPTIDNFDPLEAAKYHPIAVNAWYYMKDNLSKLLYSIEDIDQGGENYEGDYERIIRSGSLLSIFPQMAAMFRGLPAFCYNSNFAWRVDLNQSWIKLASPDLIKYGGGSRVKALYMQDDNQWAEDSQTDLIGQVYDYTMEEKIYNDITRETITKTISSGVASYEPLAGGEENALRFAKFYSKIIPMDPKSNNQSYYEGPYNEAFFPAPQVGYRKVTVSSIPTYQLRNMPPAGDPNFEGIKATGITVNEFYTSKEYPSLAYETDLFRETYVEAIVPIPFIGTITDKQVVCSQGYVIRLNDMHGKPKKVTSYGIKPNGDLSDIPTSSVEYIYKSKRIQYDGKEVLEPDNLVEVLIDDPNMRGEILAGDNPADGYQANTESAIIGMDYEFFYDMRQGFTIAGQGGLDFNLDVMGFGIFVCPVPLPWPSYSQSSAKINTIVANKIIHKAGILEKVIATDGQSRVSTQNLVFDPITGAPLLTVVNNNFDEPVYNYSVPGRFIYSGMGGSYTNSLYEFIVSSTSPSNGIIINNTEHTITVNGNAIIKNPYTGTNVFLSAITQYLHEGDEFIIEPQSGNETKSRAYLLSTTSSPVNCTPSNTELKFYIQHNITTPSPPNINALPSSNSVEYRFTLVRSGYRNLLGNNVGSIISLNTSEIDGQPPFVLNPNSVIQPSMNDLINHSPLKNRIKEDLSSSTTPFAYLSYLVPFLNDRISFFQLQTGLYYLNDPAFFSGGNHLYPELNQYLDYIIIGPSTGNNGNCLDCPMVNVQEIGTVPSGYSITIKLKQEYGGLCIHNPCFARKYFIVNAQPTNNAVLASINQFQNISTSEECKLRTFYLGSAAYEAAACSTTIGCDSLTHAEFTTILNMYNPLITSPNYESNTTSDACFDCIDITLNPYVFKIKNILQASAYLPSDVWGAIVPDMYATGKKGIWRPSVNFYYKDERYQDVNSTTIDLSGDGVFAGIGGANNNKDKMFYLFNWLADAGHPLPTKWILNNQITKYNINGIAIETKDILNIYNATIFDRNTNLPIAIADNTKRTEMLNFNFDNNDLSGATVADGLAFTGFKSLKAASDVTITLNFDDNFKLEENKNYYLSAWTGGYNMTKSPKQLDLDHPNQMNIIITFIGPNTNVQFKPTGQIYEGTKNTYWRRLEGKFTVPSGTTGITVKFTARASGYLSPETLIDDVALFDDIRLHPDKSIMKTFVYDEIDFKLKAELDENNYPMYYGYDASGQLTVVKVLTENGIKTIKEAYSNTKK